MNRRAALTGLIGAALVAASAGACACNGTQHEVEDCDAEDRANRETDCGYPPGSKPKKPAKPAKKPPKTKPKTGPKPRR